MKELHKYKNVTRTGITNSKPDNWYRRGLNCKCSCAFLENGKEHNKGFHDIVSYKLDRDEVVHHGYNRIVAEYIRKITHIELPEYLEENTEKFEIRISTFKRDRALQEYVSSIEFDNFEEIKNLKIQHDRKKKLKNILNNKNDGD